MTGYVSSGLFPCFFPNIVYYLVWGLTIYFYIIYVFPTKLVHLCLLTTIPFAPCEGRNYGYAKYANKESAMKAIQMLHGQNLSGQRIKVLEAEPPKGGEDGPTKKQKV